MRLNGYQRLKPICDDAGRVLDGLPNAVQSRLWGGLPNGTQRLGEGLSQWMLAVFELANAIVDWSPLRCDCWHPCSSMEQIRMIFNGEMQVPADAEWFATLPDFAAASVQAIDIIQCWLDDLPSESRTGENQTPTAIPAQPATDHGGKSDCGATSTPDSNAEAANKSRGPTQPQQFAFDAFEYAGKKENNLELTPKEAYDFWIDPKRGLAAEDRDEFPQLIGYDPGKFSSYKTNLSNAANHPAINQPRYGKRKRNVTGQKRRNGRKLIGDDGE